MGVRRYMLYVDVMARPRLNVDEWVQGVIGQKLLSSDANRDRWEKAHTARMGGVVLRVLLLCCNIKHGHAEQRYTLSGIAKRRESQRTSINKCHNTRGRISNNYENLLKRRELAGAGRQASVVNTETHTLKVRVCTCTRTIPRYLPGPSRPTA